MGREKRWSVWNNKTDELICCDMPSKKCAERLGMTYDSFRRNLNRFRKGQYRKYYFEEQTEEKVA